MYIFTQSDNTHKSAYAHDAVCAEATDKNIREAHVSFASSDKDDQDQLAYIVISLLDIDLFWDRQIKI